MLSRVRSIDDFGSTLLTPVAYLATGQLAAYTGLHGGMVLLTALALTAGVATVAVPAVRRVSGGTHAAPFGDADARIAGVSGGGQVTHRR
ncbi:hypothetical protein AB0M12_28505 [Nocardia vinacea]|uniref:hypothetical protein n=1 Tax=Nocardia vinacea TaxID=96468 RepID=UPI003414CA25